MGMIASFGDAVIAGQSIGMSHRKYHHDTQATAAASESRAIIVSMDVFIAFSSFAPAAVPELGR